MRDLPKDASVTPDSELAKLIGRKILAFDTDTGEVEVGFTISEAFINMQGILHGGAYATMLDTACGVAIRSRLDMEKYAGHATLELKQVILKPERRAIIWQKDKCKGSASHRFCRCDPL